MIRQAVASAPDLKTFERSLADRLQGMARSQDLLVGANWAGVSLLELTQSQLSIAVGVDRPSVKILPGPDLTLSPEATQSLGLGLHELVTNALKYGALAREGQLEIQWSMFTKDGRNCLRFAWREVCNYAVQEPAHKGFGRTVLERIVPSSVGGSAELVFAPTGLEWTLETEIEKLVPSYSSPA